MQKLIIFIKYLRNCYLVRIKWRAYKISKGFHAGRKTVIWGKSHINIGKNFYYGAYSQIGADINIGDNVVFGSYVSVVGKYDHNIQEIGRPIAMASQIRDLDYNWRGLGLMTNIGNDVWIGHKTTIMSGVSIADGTVIAAGSVVTKSTKPYAIYGGNPARFLADRFETQSDLEQHLSKLGQA